MNDATKGPFDCGSFPSDRVTCGACSGDGFVLWDAPDVEARCEQCGGSGEIEVCAFCLDEWEDGYPCPRCQK